MLWTALKLLNSTNAYLFILILIILVLLQCSFVTCPEQCQMRQYRNLYLFFSHCVNCCLSCIRGFTVVCIYCCLYFSVHYVKRPGAVLDGGSVVANLDLDDPSRVQQAQSFTGKLPQPQVPTHPWWEAAPDLPEHPCLAGEHSGGIRSARCLLQIQATDLRREADEVPQGPLTPPSGATSNVSSPLLLLLLLPRAAVGLPSPPHS